MLLVAALQPGQFRPDTRREKSQPDTILRFVAEPLDQCQLATDPAFVAAQKSVDLNLVQAVLMAEGMHHQSLLKPGNGPAHPVELQQGGLAGSQADIQGSCRQFQIPKLPAGPEPLKAVEQFMLAGSDRREEHTRL